VIVVEPNKAPEVREIANDLVSFQLVIGGYLETLQWGDNQAFVAYVNEDGLRLNLAFNAVASRFLDRAIVGTAMFTRIAACGDEVSLSNDDIQQAMAALAKGDVIELSENAK
jgi:predicted ATPase